MMSIIEIRRKYLIIGVTNTYILRRHSFPFFLRFLLHACVIWKQEDGEIDNGTLLGEHSPHALEIDSRRCMLPFISLDG
jgi:hypothetical protein